MDEHDNDNGSSNVPVHHVASLELVHGYIQRERARNRKALVWVSATFLLIVLSILAVFLVIGVFVMKNVSKTLAEVDGLGVKFALETGEITGKLGELEAKNANMIETAKTREILRVKESDMLRSDLERFGHWVASRKTVEASRLQELTKKLEFIEQSRSDREREIAELKEAYDKLLAAGTSQNNGSNAGGNATDHADASNTGAGEQNGPIEVKPVLIPNIDNLEDVRELSLPNGEKYKGQLRRGLCHGWGIYTYASGDKYEGHFRDDMKHGSGIVTYKNGDVYEGEFRNNIRHGVGILVSRGNYRYEGQFRNDMKEGNGSLAFENGDTYKGQFKNDLREGEGTYRYQDGSRYEGQFKNGKKHGRGKYFSSSGAKYEGEFEDGKRNGYGIYTFPDGAELTGFWRDDNFMGRTRP